MKAEQGAFIRERVRERERKGVFFLHRPRISPPMDEYPIHESMLIEVECAIASRSRRSLKKAH